MQESDLLLTILFLLVVTAHENNEFGKYIIDFV